MKRKYYHITIFLIVWLGLATVSYAGPPYRRGPMSSMGSGATTATTSSETSNCPWGQQCRFASVETMKQQFVQQSFDAILIETAQGQGLHLTTLARLQGCTPEEVPQFMALLQNQFSEWVDQSSEAPASSEQFLLWTRQVLKQSSTGANLCQVSPSA